MIAEYLDLIVGVTDNFSDDLYDLVGTLEYIDTLESRISPLRIRVNVHDNQLDSLERQLTRIQALEATDTFNIWYTHRPCRSTIASKKSVMM